jgi:hypothetical protein
MLTSRETLYGALFAQLQTIPGFTSYFRHPVSWKQLSDAQLPALAMRQLLEKVHTIKGLPPKYTCLVDVGIMVGTQMGPVEAVAAPTLNALLDSIEQAFTPEPITGVVNLGLDSVSRVWIESDIAIIESVPGSDDRSFALIPVWIVCQ